MIADRTQDEADRDGRLAWLVVAGCTLLTLTLLVGLVLALRGPIGRAIADVGQGSPERTDWRPVAEIPPDTARPIGRPADWLMRQDRPVAALSRGEAGSVRVTLAVLPSGTASGCQVAQSSGYPSLDSGTCLALMRTARFEPARAGEPGSRPGEVRRWTSPVITWRSD